MESVPLNKNIEKVNLSGTTFKLAPQLWREKLNERRDVYSSKYGIYLLAQGSLTFRLT